MKYFFNPSSQTSSYSPFLISPSKVGGLSFLNSSRSRLSECFLFFPLVWEWELVLPLEDSLELSVSSWKESSIEFILAPCWDFFEMLLLVWPLSRPWSCISCGLGVFLVWCMSTILEVGPCCSCLCISDRLCSRIALIYVCFSCSFIRLSLSAL